MRRLLLLPIVVVSFFIVIVTNSRTAQAQRRDPQAVTIVTRALNALGGSSTVAQITDCTIEGTSTTQRNNQYFAGHVTWLYSNGQVRYDYIGADGTDTFASGHGNSRDRHNGTITNVPYHITRALLSYHLPALVLYTFLQRPLTQNPKVVPGESRGKLGGMVLGG